VLLGMEYKARFTGFKERENSCMFSNAPRSGGRSFILLDEMSSCCNAIRLPISLGSAVRRFSII